VAKESKVSTFVLQACMHRSIESEMIQRWHADAPLRVLHVLHNRPATAPGASRAGGVELHVADLIRGVPAAHWSLCR
jgi:hypothetical protein